MIDRLRSACVPLGTLCETTHQKSGCSKGGRGIINDIFLGGLNPSSNEKAKRVYRLI